jgi:hypothetical protein
MLSDGDTQTFNTPSTGASHDNSRLAITWPQGRSDCRTVSGAGSESELAWVLSNFARCRAAACEPPKNPGRGQLTKSPKPKSAKIIGNNQRPIVGLLEYIRTGKDARARGDHCATFGARSQRHPDHAERALGHVIGGVRGVYRHAYRKEKRQAFPALAARIEQILRTPVADVPDNCRDPQLAQVPCPRHHAADWMGRRRDSCVLTP